MNYRETYQQLAIGELLQLAQQQDTLTDEAQQALAAELQRRGLAIEPAGDSADPQVSAQVEAPVAEPDVWWKRELWVRLLIWVVVAAVFNILAILAAGARYSDITVGMTSQFVLVAVLGCALSEALPERWRSWKATLAVAVAVLLAWSCGWLLLRA